MIYEFIIYFLLSFIFSCESPYSQVSKYYFFLETTITSCIFGQKSQLVWARKLQCLKPGALQPGHHITVSRRLKPQWMTHLGRKQSCPGPYWQTLPYSVFISAVNWLSHCQNWNIKKVPIRRDNFKHLSLWHAYICFPDRKTNTNNSNPIGKSVTHSSPASPMTNPYFIECSYLMKREPYSISEWNEMPAAL